MIYTHDCDNCKFLCTGRCKALGDDVYDFYICGNDRRDARTMIARYGNEDSEYISGMLFCCVELTAFDKVALFNGLELTEKDKEKLLGCLSRMWKNKLSIEDYKSMNVSSLSFEAKFAFGNGNVVFED